MNELPAAGAAILLVTVVLAGAAVGQTPIEEDPDLPDLDIPYPDPPGATWSGTLVYELDEGTGEVESYRAVGDLTLEHRCRGGWSTTASWAVSAFDDDPRIVYRVGHPIGDASPTILAGWTWDGSTVYKEIRCHGDRPDVVGHEPLWEIQRFEHPNGTGCDGPPDLGDRRVAPRSGGFVDQATAGDAAPLPCLEASAGGSLTTGEPIPFTGQVTATLTDGQGRTVVAETCTMVGGGCWSGGGSWNETIDPDVAGSTWTLTCEADTLFGIRMPTAGDFGCQAWLPG